MEHDNIPPISSMKPSGRYLFAHKTESQIVLRTTDAKNPWPGLQSLFLTMAVQIPFLFSKPTLNFELPFQLTCRAAHLPAVIGTGYNLPWTLHTIDLIKPDVWIGPQDSLELLHKTLASKPQALPRHMFFVSDTAPEQSQELPAQGSINVFEIRGPAFHNLV